MILAGLQKRYERYKVLLNKKDCSLILV